jgi:hypothetical protein
MCWESASVIFPTPHLPTSTATRRCATEPHLAHWGSGPRALYPTQGRDPGSVCGPLCPTSVRQPGVLGGLAVTGLDKADSGAGKYEFAAPGSRPVPSSIGDPAGLLDLLLEVWVRVVPPESLSDERSLGLCIAWAGLLEVGTS